jgi:hypothetical protein
MLLRYQELWELKYESPKAFPGIFKYTAVCREILVRDTQRED